MKKLILFAACILLLCNCTQKADINAFKDEILRTETAKIPLYLQDFPEIQTITIDSMVIISNAEPYSGYLVTHWEMDVRVKPTVEQLTSMHYKDKYVRKNEQVLIPVDMEINYSLTFDGIKSKVSWMSNWHQAYYQIRNKYIF